MLTSELIKILYALKKVYGKSEGSKLFEKLIKLIYP